ncbi:MAG: penicillin-binding protein 2, partial [Bacteroidales bacterium]|nr:penicillin-binding protein 2 [Bacteroidales bacterium]
SYNPEPKFGAGFEKAFNTELEGVGGRRLTRRVAKGVWRPIYNEETVDPQNGKDIVTTIDTRIQDVAHAALERCVRENEADHGCAVLMEVATGRIVAIANLTRQPDGRYAERINYVVGESVEPGSTFKLASAIAILEAGQFDTATVVPTGVMEFYGRRMIDSRRQGYGDLSFQQAFAKSSNVGISYLAHETFHKNPQKFVDYLYGMRLNEITGIEIPGEGRPYIKNPKDKSWSRISVPWMSIGYEVQLTPLQILALYNAVANGGKMMKPRLVDEIRQGGKTVARFEPVVLQEKIASRKTLDRVRGMLEEVVQTGTGRSLSKSPYKIAGKTGTAQMNYARRGDEKMRYRASFAGYFPAEKPLYSCMIMISDPQKRHVYGSDLAAPVFKEIADKVYATLLKDRPEGGQHLA